MRCLGFGKLSKDTLINCFDSWEFSWKNKIGDHILGEIHISDGLPDTFALMVFELTHQSFKKIVHSGGQQFNRILLGNAQNECQKARQRLVYFLIHLVLHAQHR